jgi:hypothetical protein
LFDVVVVMERRSLASDNRRLTVSYAAVAVDSKHQELVAVETLAVVAAFDCYRKVIVAVFDSYTLDFVKDSAVMIEEIAVAAVLEYLDFAVDIVAAFDCCQKVIVVVAMGTVAVGVVAATD